jgi:hypothetical protein
VKEAHGFINRRDRMVRNAWKHGILGVENPEDNGNEFY